MREQSDVSAGLGSGSPGSAESGMIYIITLSSSTAPVPLEAPSVPGLAGLAVFRSRRVEDGRDRFRLHLGYFDSVAAAEAVLPAVRRQYPAAWVGPAPNSGMGSLDDTSVTQFKFIKAPNTILREPAPSPAAVQAAPVAHAALGPTTAVAASASQRGATSASASKTSSRVAAAAAPASVPGLTKASAGAKLAKPTAKPTLAAKPTQAAKPAVATPLKSKEVLDLLESSTLAHAPVARPAMQPVERAAVIGAIQRFAVQIVWSMDPVDLAKVPKLAIFDAYTLYKVQVDRAGRRWYGLRLGFFGDPVSARQVALYARSDFSAAAVVPVSDRECQRADQAAITALPSAPAPAKVEDQITFIDDAGDASREVRRAPVAQAAREPRSRDKPKTAAPAKRTQTTQEMADELEMAPDFGRSSGPLNDSGVRHLNIEVLNRTSALGKLFGRGSKRR